jgi:hypothetical protein
MGDVMFPPKLMTPRNHTGSRPLVTSAGVSFVTTTKTNREEEM